MNISLLDILIVLSLSQGFIFGFVLLFSNFFKGNANRFLAYAILMLSVIGMNEWLSDWGFDDKYYFVDYFGDDVPWILLVYVALFVYFVKSVRHPLGSQRKLWWLALPFGVFFVLNWVINLEYDFQFYEMPGMNTFRRITYETEYYLAVAYSLLLSILSYRIIQKSELPEEESRWIRRIWWFTVVLLSCWMGLALLPRGFDEADAWLFYVLWFGVSCFIYWLTFKGLYQFHLARDRHQFKTLFKKEPEQAVVESIPAPAEVRKLDPNNPYIQQLEQLMQAEKLFRRPDLSRDDIAEKLGISVGYLSQVLNENTGKNFNTYVNGYRVKDVQATLQNPASDRFSLLAIGMEAGFKSKSAFYTHFKKETGMTPSAYKKNCR